MKRFLAIFLAVLGSLSMTSCSFLVFSTYREVTNRADEALSSGDFNIVYEGSYLSDVQRDGDTVIYICEIAVENSGDVKKSVLFIAHFEDEFEAGILNENSLVGEIVSGDNIIEAGEKTVLTVVFKGEISSDYDGETLICDRELPEISCRVDIVH